MRQILFVLGLALSAPAFALGCNGGPLDQPQKRLLGGSENLCTQYGGKVLLVVNTASHCGFTPQFEGIEKLYKTYKDRGLVVLGFPSGDFHQEESSDESIAKFCSANYGVSFPMYTKTMVKGDDANPLYKALRASTGHAPGWNFNKYLIARDGKVLAWFPSEVEPQSAKLTQLIEAELAKPAPVTSQPVSSK
jgi:glutathione peroxidase